MKNGGEWRPVADWDSNEWGLTSAAAVCRQMHCGSAVSTEMTEDASDRPVWWIKSSCIHSASALLDCVIMTDVIETYTGLEVICSGNITFTVCCSVCGLYFCDVIQPAPLHSPEAAPGDLLVEVLSAKLMAIME